MSRIIHFEIPASDPERAASFYRKAFGWKIEKWPGRDAGRLECEVACSRDAWESHRRSG